jgi:hypothetical protein
MRFLPGLKAGVSTQGVSMNLRKRMATLVALTALAVLGLIAPGHAATTAHQHTTAAVSGNGPDNRCC